LIFLIHYSAWLARRWGDPAFPAAFPWFNTQRYWQDRILELREQVTHGRIVSRTCVSVSKNVCKHGIKSVGFIPTR
jgi:hypothetical protein